MELAEVACVLAREVRSTGGSSRQQSKHTATMWEQLTRVQKKNDEQLLGIAAAGQAQSEGLLAKADQMVQMLQQAENACQEGSFPSTPLPVILLWHGGRLVLVFW